MLHWLRRNIRRNVSRTFHCRFWSSCGDIMSLGSPPYRYVCPGGVFFDLPEKAVKGCLLAGLVRGHGPLRMGACQASPWVAGQLQPLDPPCVVPRGQPGPGAEVPKSRSHLPCFRQFPQSRRFWLCCRRCQGLRSLTGRLWRAPYHRLGGNSHMPRP